MTSENNTQIINLSKLNSSSTAKFGGKASNLGELINSGINVPEGFAISTDLYFDFLNKSNLKDKITKLLENSNSLKINELQKLSNQIKELFNKTQFDKEIISNIEKEYKGIGSSRVAVRSSATSEDSMEASFAGQQNTYLNIIGFNSLIESIKACWASVFEARAIFYRNSQNIAHFESGMSVVIQQMVQPDVSGVMFTLEPTTLDPDKIVIEAAFGLGEAVVSGIVTPDYYVIEKSTQTVVRQKHMQQTFKIALNDENENTGMFSDINNQNINIPLTPEESLKPKLTVENLKRLAQQALLIEEHYNYPQDIEFAMKDDQIYLLQSRPVTNYSRGVVDTKKVSLDFSNAEVIIKGSGASPGYGAGKAVIVKDLNELDQVKEGDILVTEMTTPDFVPIMRIVSGIITDRGGRTCHAAIVSRELGVPCVVGAYDSETGKTATSEIHNGQNITLDGSEGNVYEGLLDIPEEDQNQESTFATNTKIYVNLADPISAPQVSERNVDGIGLLRAEFIIANIGKHPKQAMKEGTSEQWTKELSDNISIFCESFGERPVVYRLTDFKTNEYRNLKGGELFENTESNPMMGYRGAIRYINDTDVFELEVNAIKHVLRKYNNLIIMIPFVRTPNELREVISILNNYDISIGKGHKIWMMVEVPSNVILINQFINEGINGISIGSNDLTELTLGVDRDNEKLEKSFDERDPSILWALERVISAANKQGITSSICGQAPSFFPDLTERLVKWGITSVSVSPDSIDSTRNLVYRIEQQF